jgi:hypothetical protein
MNSVPEKESLLKQTAASDLASALQRTFHSSQGIYSLAVVAEEI